MKYNNICRVFQAPYYVNFKKHYCPKCKELLGKVTESHPYPSIIYVSTLNFITAKLFFDTDCTQDRRESNRASAFFFKRLYCILGS